MTSDLHSRISIDSSAYPMLFEVGIPNSGSGVPHTLFFSSYCPLRNLALKTCNQDISKIIIASSFKLGQFIEENELHRVHTHQGNVREILFFSRSGNCQGILCCVREKLMFSKMSGNCQGILQFPFFIK